MKRSAFGLVTIAILIAGCDAGRYASKTKYGARLPNGLATDDDLARLADDPDCDQLSVYGFGITDKGVARLQGLTGLRTLDLNFTRVTDDGLEHLEGLPQLHTLDLRGSYRITDSGLKHLHGLRDLQTLNLTFTQVTKDGIKALKTALPGVRVFQAYSPDSEDLDKGYIANASRLGARRDNLRAYRDWYKKRKEDDDWVGVTIAIDHVVGSGDHSELVLELFAHCLTYSVSDEVDDVNGRYFWIKQGIQMLLHGVEWYEDQPMMVHNVGWYVGLKIGRSEEAMTYRRLFRDDTDFHDLLGRHVDLASTKGQDGKPDNWLVAQQFFVEAIRRYELGHDIGDKSPLIFLADPAMMQADYAAAIEREGVFGEAAVSAWQKAEQMWNEFGDRDVPTTWGKPIRLNEFGGCQKRAEQLWAQLHELAPGSKKKLRERRVQSLSESQRMALEKGPDERSLEEAKLAYEAEEAIQISPQDVAESVGPDRRKRATQLAEEIDDLETTAQRIKLYRVIINYDHWMTRCKVEQTDEVLQARRDLHLATQNAGSPKAAALFEGAFAVWVDIFERYPVLRDYPYWDDLQQALKVHSQQSNAPLGDAPSLKLQEILEASD